MEEVPQRLFALKSNFALADPFQYGIAPLPLREQGPIVRGQLDREIELPLFENGPVDIGRRQHVFGLQHHRIQPSRFFSRHRFSPMHQQRRQLVRSISRNFDIAFGPHSFCPILSTYFSASYVSSSTKVRIIFNRKCSMVPIVISYSSVSSRP